MSDHTHLKQPINICCFYESLVTSTNSTLYLNLFLRYSSLKNPAFCLALRFFNHNSRTRFFPNMLFLREVKRSLKLSYWGKKSIYIPVDKICCLLTTLKSSCLSPPTPSELFFQKPGSATFLTLWCLTSRKKIRKKKIVQRSCIADRWKDEQSQIYRTLLLGWVSNYFAPRRRYGPSVAVWW